MSKLVEIRFTAKRLVFLNDFDEKLFEVYKQNVIFNDIEVDPNHDNIEVTNTIDPTQLSYCSVCENISIYEDVCYNCEV